MAAGDPAERRFYRAELTREERIPEYARFLDAHLRKTRVVSEEARRSAEQRHESNREREKARRAIPGAWQTLLKTPDEMLRDLLAEEVERSCGTKPEPEDVASFLKARLSEALPGTPTVAPSAPRPRSSNSSSSTPTPPTKKKPTRIIGYILDNKQVETGFSYQTLGEVVKEFHRRDPEFMVRFAARTPGRKLCLVARNRHDLYPENPDLVEKRSLDLENGWWLGHNLSTRAIRKKIIIACEVAGVTFGSQLKLIES